MLQRQGTSLETSQKADIMWEINQDFQGLGYDFSAENEKQNDFIFRYCSSRIELISHTITYLS